MPARPRILLVDPLFEMNGGGAAVAVHALQALKDAFDVTLLTWNPPALATANERFGTTLTESDFRLRLPPRLLWVLGETLNALDPDPYGAQRWGLLMRYARNISAGFDGVLSTNDEADVGFGVQYIHYPYFGARRSAPGGKQRMAWYRPWRLLSGFSFERMKQNLTLVNSDWTGSVFEAFYGSPTRTLYPPVTTRFPRVSWQEQEDGFVCIGRIAPDKNLERVVEIVRTVRQTHPHVHLHLVGTHDDMEYLRAIRALAAPHRDWIHLWEDLPHEQLVDLVAHKRWGIHAKENEHFGIAVAELVQGGCLPFVHDSGGQVEIVANRRRLCYRDTDEAVAQIRHLLDNATDRADVRRALLARRERFSTERFGQTLREIMEEHIALRASTLSAAA